jgi:hypothetical protein
MELNRQHRGDKGSFVRSVAMYAVFVITLALVAMLNARTAGLGAYETHAPARAVATGSVSVDAAPADDPSVPPASQALTTPAGAPAEAAPTF